MSLDYPTNITQPDEDEGFGSFVRFKLYERPNSQSSSLVQTINLYMPQAMNNPLSATWDQMPLGSALGQYAEGAGSLSTLAAGVNQQAQQIMHSAQGAFSSLNAATFSPEQGAAANEIRNQELINPYIKMLFKGHNFRNFSMVFKFTPKSMSESDRIKEIIKEFRKAASPQISGDKVKQKYPYEIEVEYWMIVEGSPQPHKFLNKFKKSVITDINVNYTGAGMYAAMRDGFPAETELRLSFSENELVWRDDIEEGY